jgi:hypothetical protein
MQKYRKAVSFLLTLYYQLTLFCLISFVVMRWISTLLFFLVSGFSADAQHLTGIWRGYFTSTGGTLREFQRKEMYKYEIQIEQLPNNAVKGVTYSYKTSVFYAKTGLQGIFTYQSKSLLLKETKILELKIDQGSAPCLMTCYLDYSKIDKLEVLQGTFISESSSNKSDCGSGEVYLEKVNSSDFTKEDFLLKKKPEAPKAHVPLAKSKTDPPHPPAVKKPGATVQQSKPAGPKSPAPIKPIEHADNAIAHSWKADTAIRHPRELIANRAPVPRVLLERENKLVKTLYCGDEEIRIDLYDNGTIDNDTISLYHNNKLVVSNGRLSYSAITYKTKCNATDNHHEFVIVAENLGDIPPNTALMVVTMGKSQKRYEIFLTSTEQRNAKVVVEYKPQH